MEQQVPSTSSTSQNVKEFNIILLGETGVGKSTFINSFPNYFHLTTFDNAVASKLECLIPLKFTVSDENYEETEIEFGPDDKNEDTKLGNSSTQGTKSYLFPFEQYSLRIIDTPGIGDPRGIKQDNTNFENVLTYISQYEHLHGICFLLKPNVSILNAYFKFCIVHLLSRLEKSAVNNIIFVFTNSRGTCYRPGETLPVLRRILKEIKDMPPHVVVPCNRQNMFYVDNEAFKFLIAKKSGINLDDSETKEMAMSWDKSYKTCKEILALICGTAESQPLQPHELQNTITVNKVWKIITDLSKPLADICDFIQVKLVSLKRSQKELEEMELEEMELSREYLLSKMHIPDFELKVVKFDGTVMVCTSPRCSEMYSVHGVNRFHYRQKCTLPSIVEMIPKPIFGVVELICAWMNIPGILICQECYCPYSVHMRMNYETRLVEAVESIQKKERREDEIKTKEDEINAKKSTIKELMDTRKEYEYEGEEISKCMAKFSHFLKENSISAYNDAYLDYLNYFIEREKQLGDQKDEERIKNYTSLQLQYKNFKRILDEQVKNTPLIGTDIIKEIPALVKKLYKLKYTGAKIKELHLIQDRSIQKFIKSKEYIFPHLLKNTTG